MRLIGQSAIAELYQVALLAVLSASHGVIIGEEAVTQEHHHCEWRISSEGPAVQIIVVHIPFVKPALHVSAWSRYIELEYYYYFNRSTNNSCAKDSIFQPVLSAQ